MYAATRISAFSKGAEVGIGTAFYYQVDVPGLKKTSIPILITNKHVIEGADHIVFRAHVSGADGKPTGKVHHCSLETGYPNVVHHPDPNVDLCAIIVTGILREAAKKGEPIFYVSIDDSLIPSADEWATFDAMENLLMVGCPRGIYDEYNNIPIFRRGYTATPLSKNYEGSEVFLVDMACYPGSSGSPIFIYDTNGYFDIGTNSQVIGQRVKFAGVLFRGPLIDSKGRIVFQNIPTVEVQSMMHLGEAIKSTEVKRLSDEVINFAKAHSRPPDE